MMKHINEYNIFDNVALSWESTQEDADDLAEALKYKYDLLDTDIKVTKMSEGIYSIQLKSYHTNVGHLFVGLSMVTGYIKLYVRGNYTIANLNDRQVNIWKIIPNIDDKSWEDLVYKVRIIIDKALQHIEEIEALEKKLEDTWNKATWDYPMRTNLTLEDGKAIYNVK